MKNTDVVGYRHQDGFFICPSCYSEITDTDTTTIEQEQEPYEPVLEIDNESQWPGSCCEWCREHIEGSLIILDDSLSFVKTDDVPEEILKKFDLEDTFVIYKIECKDIEDEISTYKNVMVDIIKKKEKIALIGDSNYEIDYENGDAYIIVYF